MELKLNNGFVKMTEHEMSEIDGGFGGLLGTIGNFLVGRLTWTTANISSKTYVPITKEPTY